MWVSVIIHYFALFLLCDGRWNLAVLRGAKKERKKQYLKFIFELSIYVKLLAWLLSGGSTLPQTWLVLPRMIG